MAEQDACTPFAELCDQAGWGNPAVFVRVYASVARRLGESPELTDRQVRRWRAVAPPCPQPGRQRILEAMLGIPLERAGFAVPVHRRNLVAAPVLLTDSRDGDLVGESEAVDRRAFIAATGVAALGVALPVLHEQPLLGAETVDDLRKGLTSLYGLDDRFGGATVGPLAAAHLSRINRLIDTGRYPETVGRQLRLLAGETAEHVGWLAFDAGDRARARTYLTTAMSRAEELRDDSLGVLVSASLALVSLRQERPREALNLVHRAYEKARPWAPSALLSILVTREARALAQLGDAAAARTTLARAARLYEQDQGSQPAPTWTLFHGPAEIANAQAHLFTATGHHRAAVTWLRRTLERQETSYARNEALHRGTLSAALARCGEAEEATHELAQADALLTEVSSGRARDAVDEARRELNRLQL